MRIAIDYTAAVCQGAGIGRYTRQLTQALLALDPENRYVLLSAGGKRTEPPWPPNVRRRTLPLSDHHLAMIWQRLRLPLFAECLTGAVDLFHSPDFVLPPLLKARSVVTIHDLSFMRLPQCSAPSLLEYLMRSVPRAARRADAILADSHSTREDVIELLDVAPERVHVIYAGVDERFAPQPAEAVREVTSRHGLRTPYLLAVGTLQPRKNYPILMQAFAALRKRASLPHTLAIVGGRGWLTEEIDATIARLGLEDQVQLLGFAPDADLPALYTGASLLAFPSLYEGFGLPALEAMACGTPVVGSTAPSLPEVCGDAALLVDPTDATGLADALERVLIDEELAHTLVSRGRRRAAQFRWEDAAANLLSVYRQVVGQV
ncbi:MAG: glycosyltransferase family 4 protein [Anaerolineae bacterium]|jgi:glycosyltransferase involved in cell wall biosynthesis